MSGTVTVKHPNNTKQSVNTDWGERGVGDFEPTEAKQPVSPSSLSGLNKGSSTQISIIFLRV